MNQLFVFSQNDAINRFVLPTKDIDFVGDVKNITIHHYSFSKNKKTVDTVKTINKILFDKKGIITKQFNCVKSIEDPWQTIEYDNKGRIKTIFRKNNDKISLFAEQFFNDFSEYPDSLNIYRG